MNDRGWIREDDRDCIKPNLAPLDTGPRRVTTGRMGDTFLFLAVDGTFGAAELGGVAGLNLYENQSAVVTGDDVHFSVSGTRTVISCHNRKARAPQVAVRQIFTTPAERGVRGQCVPLAKLPG